MGEEVEDEQHLTFACPHYSDLRAERQDLFAAPGMDLKDFLEQDPGRVAAFVAACRRRAAETIHDEDLQALFGQSQIQERDPRLRSCAGGGGRYSGPEAWRGFYSGGFGPRRCDTQLHLLWSVLFPLQGDIETTAQSWAPMELPVRHV
jgi:hypothetical protein